MPTSTRRHGHPRTRNSGTNEQAIEVQDDHILQPHGPVAVEPDQYMDDEIPRDSGEEYDPEDEDEGEPEVFPPLGLKEISSLASWTVSTAKPGNGVAALRSPDLAHFWQSDGPQPHLLSIHFFKLVSIVSIRVFLDFENDESYTPTKIQFLAGMGLHDIQEFAEMSFTEPRGWHEVDFSNVGPMDEDDADGQSHKEVDWSKRPVLRAFIVQVRILENHQNGKDTHLRAVQLFARDEAQLSSKNIGNGKSVVLPTRTLFKESEKSRMSNNIKLAPWMLEPDLR